MESRFARIAKYELDKGFNIVINSRDINYLEETPSYLLDCLDKNIIAKYIKRSKDGYDVFLSVKRINHDLYQLKISSYVSGAYDDIFDNIVDEGIKMSKEYTIKLIVHIMMDGFIPTYNNYKLGGF